ncbi:39S ribosomal protein L51, mitochondrial [Elasticomyces elasticus]|uniref:Large ribosomal subunit protein mL43 n=1 Tax=Exophiala sideris TaxID=1016849 RepID=A0ABR0J1V8_9EURO|nr:39S ribosomal protein L51, mitochondrial [Elasticomyces elasticus]KAK5024710.1 39S ribosomal protein L51, mitochondrial [Exophiala sideris]KAK5030804.1 39S ribosomal protein L51, mitochondrial [Exophiala sideris]KAK5054345.1 39S ribosomal protein L51, mitochondrial [Exophiala sideris]KAK5179746.1 39S ribosomal protein L51, mitochondrial [Eurotiomycetes sp. CCFEE 6388]
MVVQGLKTVSTPRNGLGAFILQCKRLDFHYCDWAGSSRGMKSFLTSPLLASFTQRYPGTEFRISPRPNKHPIVKAYFINGREKAVCLRNLEKDQILKKVEFLVTNSGKKNELIRGKNVVSVNENVRGIWSPMHGGIKTI